MANLITMTDIIKSYKMGSTELVVLKKISLEIKKGEFVAILGPSGSGKTTLMNLIGCIDTCNDGIYNLNGTNIEKKSDNELAEIRNQEIGFIFQKFNLLSKYTALHNVAFPLLIRGVPKKDAYEKAEEILKKVGLGDRVHHKPIELSGGQQQRVSVARALVGDPNLLLADEPTGALDSKTGEEIMNLFHKLNIEGNTIIMITHDNEIAKQAGRIIRIVDGEIVV